MASKRGSKRSKRQGSKRSKRSKKSKKGKYDLDRLKKKSSSELRDLAKKTGIPYAGKNKSMLIDSLTKLS